MSEKICKTEAFRCLFNFFLRLANHAICVLIIGTCTLGLDLSLANAQATFTPLGVFGGVRSGASDVSADGSVVVGTFVDAAGPTLSLFRWTLQETDVRPTGIAGSTSADVAVSTDGSTVAGTFQSGRGEEAFRWEVDGELEGLGDLPGGGFRSNAFGVSANGSVIVGTSLSGGELSAFHWTTNRGMVSLGSNERTAQDVSADGSVIVGDLAGSVSTSAYRWTQQSGSIVLPPLPGGNLVAARSNAVSADGSVIVGHNTFRVTLGTTADTAFRWSEQEGTVSLESGGWAGTVALGVSADGSAVVGRGIDPEFGGTGAFYWSEPTGMISVKDLLIGFGADNITGWHLLSADAISEDGRTIVGSAVGPNAPIQAFVATVPEPSGIVLGIIGALGLLAVFSLRLRRRRAMAA